MKNTDKQIGATVVERGAEFRVCAPDAQAVAVQFEHEKDPLDLASEGGGFYAGYSTTAQTGTRYPLSN